VVRNQIRIDGQPAVPEDEFDLEAHAARVGADMDAGLIEVPEPSQGLSVSVPGLEGLGRQDVAGFAEGSAEDQMPAGSLLAVLSDQAAADLDLIDDNQLLGLAGAGRKLAARGEWLQLAAVAEFTTRRRQATIGGGRPARQRAEFAATEVGLALRMSEWEARTCSEHADTLKRRLPFTFRAMRTGAVDGYAAKIIAICTRRLTDALARDADVILSQEAAALTHGELWREGRELAAQLDPAGDAGERERAKQDRRLQKFRERSGLAGLAARELDPVTVAAIWQDCTIRAQELMAAGVPGTLTAIRVQVFTDRLLGQDTLTGLIPPQRREGGSGTDDTDDTDADPADDTDADGAGGGDGPEEFTEGWDNPGHDGTYGDGENETGGSGRGGGPGRPPRKPRPPAPGKGDGKASPVAALINLTLSLSSYLGAGDTPGRMAGFGTLDPQSARDLADAAAQHPATRWCLTVVDDQTGRAVAHGCARGPRAHGERAGPPPAGSGQIAEFLRRLKLSLAPIAAGTCEHRYQVHKHDPSRLLTHLTRARNTTCATPGCGAAAVYTDNEHTTPWEDGGLTCECGICPVCRRHHRAKQCPGWTVTQPEPGVLIWETPSGRHYRTGPDKYRIPLPLDGRARRPLEPAGLLTSAPHGFRGTQRRRRRTLHERPDFLGDGPPVRGRGQLTEHREQPQVDPLQYDVGLRDPRICRQRAAEVEEPPRHRRRVRTAHRHRPA
jgi:hypothetical protein